MTVDLSAGPGRRARTAVLALRYCRVEIARPVSHKRPAADLATLPRSVTLTLVEAREIGAPATGPAVHWRLLTTHAVTDVAHARRLTGFSRSEARRVGKAGVSTFNYVWCP